MSEQFIEQRIIDALERWAKSYEARAVKRAFGFDRYRAAALRKAAQAIREGRHR